MENKTTIRAYLSLFSDHFPLEDVTERLGVQPTSTYRKGDKGKYSIKKETSWDFETEEMYTLYVSEPINEILDIFESKINLINEIKNDYDLTIKLFIVIVIEDNCSPAIIIDHRLVSFLHAISAEIDIDQYIN